MSSSKARRSSRASILSISLLCLIPSKFLSTRPPDPGSNCPSIKLDGSYLPSFRVLAAKVLASNSESISLLVLFSYFIRTQVCYDFTELFEGGFEVVDNFLGEDIEISNITPGPLTSSGLGSKTVPDIL